MKITEYLVVLSDPLRRNKVASMLEQIHFRCAIFSASSLEHGVTLLDRGKKFTALLIGSEFRAESIARFIERARGTQSAKSAAFVMLVEDQRFTDLDLVEGMFAGAHGFLKEPFTAEQMAEIMKLAPGVNNQGSFARLKVATGLAFRQVIQSAPRRPARTPEQSPGLVHELKDAFRQFRRITGGSMTLPVMRSFGEATPLQRLHKYRQMLRWMHRLIASQ